MYIYDYFRERGNYEVTDYEKTFEKIYCHGETAYPYDDQERDLPEEYNDPKGYIYSYSRIREQLENEILSNTTESLELKWKDVSNATNPLLKVDDNQLMIRNNYMKLPVQVKFAENKLIQYDPFTRTFLIPDIYHELNEFTNMVLNAMKEVERIWSIRKSVNDPWKNDNKQNYALINGNVYEMKEVKGGMLNFQKERERHRKQLEELMERLDQSGEGGLTIPSRVAYDLMENQISAYITSEGDILISKQLELKVDKVIATSNDRLATSIPDEFVEHTEGKVVIRCKKIKGNEFYPLMMTGFGSDIAHPHRFREGGYGGEDILNMCGGDVRNDELQDTYQIIQKFDEIKGAMNVVNIDSIASGEAVKNDAEGDFYRTLHMILNPQKYEKNRIINYVEAYARSEEEEQKMLQYMEERE